MKETLMSLTIDNVVLSAEVPLGATLAQFLQTAGFACEQQTLTNGTRALSPDLELAHRFREANLSTEVSSEMLEETPSLLVEELLVLAERG